MCQALDATLEPKWRPANESRILLLPGDGDGLVKDHAEYWSPDGVHFNTQGITAQVEQVSKKITGTLE